MVKLHSSLKPTARTKLVSELTDLVRRYNIEIQRKYGLTKREELRFALSLNKSFMDFITGGSLNPEDYDPKFKYNFTWSHQRHLICFYPLALKAAFDYLSDKCEKISGKYYFIESLSSFEDLHQLVWTIQKEKKINPDLKGFGNLDIYDFCIRYSYNRAKHLLPVEYVYVDHGHTADSTKILGILLSDFPRIIKGKIRYDDCPDWLKCYKDLKSGRIYTIYSKDIENFLCHYYSDIKILFLKYDPVNYRIMFPKEFKTK